MRTIPILGASRLAGVALCVLCLGCPGVTDVGLGGDRMLAGSLQGEDGASVHVTMVLLDPALASLRVPGTLGSGGQGQRVQVRVQPGDGPGFDLVGVQDVWGGFEASADGWSMRGAVAGQAGEIELSGPEGFAAGGTVKADEPEANSFLAGYCFCRPVGLRPTCVRCTKDTVLCCVADPVGPDPALRSWTDLFPKCPPR